MLYFNFKITNPFRAEVSRSYFCIFKSLTKNKHIEVESTYHSQTLFQFEVDVSFIGKDHAGVSLDLTIFHRNLRVVFYDSRHWNYDTQTWEIYENE